MYKVVRRGRILDRSFDSYEEARSWARSIIRKSKSRVSNYFTDWSLRQYRNPSLSVHNCTIVKVN